MADIRINQLPEELTPAPTDNLAIDGVTTRRTTIQKMVEVGRPVASQAEAEAGTNPTKAMTPLTTAQAIAFQAATAAQGGKADTALQPTAIGVSLQAYDAALQSISGLTTVADRMIYTTGADTYAAAPITAFGRSLVDDANSSAARTTLGVAIGSDVQAFDAGLLSIAGLTTSADQMPYTTGVDAYATTALTPFARTILDDAAASDVRTTLGLATIAATGSAADLVGPIQDPSLALRDLLGEGVNLVNSWRGYDELNTFTATGAAKSNVDGYLKLIASAASTQITLSGLAINGTTERYLAIRYRRTVGTPGWDADEDAFAWQTSGHGFTGSFLAKIVNTSTAWKTAYLDMWNPSVGGTDWKEVSPGVPNTITGIRFFAGNGVGANIDIAWIATASDSPRRGDVQNDLRYMRISSFNEIKLKARGVTAGNTAAANTAILDSVMAELAASSFPVGVVEFPNDWISFTGDRIYGSSTHDKSITFISPAGGRQILTSGSVGFKITNRFGELVFEDMHCIAQDATSMTQIVELTNTGTQKGLKMNRNKFLRSGTTPVLIGALIPRHIAGQFCDNDFQTGLVESFADGGVGMRFTGSAGMALEGYVARNNIRSTGLAFDVICGGTKAAPGIEGLTFRDNNIVGCRYGYQIVGIDDSANGYLAPLFDIKGGHINVYETPFIAKNVSDVYLQAVNMYIDQFSGAPYSSGYFVYLEKVWSGNISTNIGKMADSIPTGGAVKDIIAAYYLASGTKDLKIHDNQTMITTNTPHVWIRTGAFANEVYDNKKVAVITSVGSNVVEESAGTNTLRDNTGRVYS